MEGLFAVLIGALTAAGLYLCCLRQVFPVVLGLSLLSYATNLFVFVAGRLTVGAPPIWGEGVTRFADPLPQALVLTAIVISFGMTALLVVLAIRARFEAGEERIDVPPVTRATETDR